MDITSTDGLLSVEDVAAGEQAAWEAYQASSEAAERAIKAYEVASAACHSAWGTWMAARNAVREVRGAGRG